MADTDIVWENGDISSTVFFTRSEYEEFSYQYKLFDMLIKKEKELHPAGPVFGTRDKSKDPEKEECAKNLGTNKEVSEIGPKDIPIKNKDSLTPRETTQEIKAVTADDSFLASSNGRPSEKVSAKAAQGAKTIRPDDTNIVVDNIENPSISEVKPCNINKEQKQAVTKSQIWVVDEEETTDKVFVKQNTSSYMPYQPKFPRPSWLTMAEHRLYLSLQKKHTGLTARPQDKTPAALKEFQRFKELHQKVTAEQEEFLAFTEAEATGRPVVYRYIHPEALRFTDEYIKSLCGRVIDYDPYYVQLDSVPLISRDVPFVPFEHIKCLLQIGEIPRAIMPHTETMRRPKLKTEFNQVTQAFPLPGSFKGKPTCSQDANAEKLAIKYAASMVISASAIKCLLDHGNNMERQWELPVVIKEQEIKDERGNRTQKVVYVDKPFPPRSMLTAQRKSWYHKFAMKCTIQHKKHKSSHIFGKKMSDKTEDDIQEPLCSLDDLETFGVNQKTEPRPSAFKKYVRPEGLKSPPGSILPSGIDTEGINNKDAEHPDKSDLPESLQEPNSGKGVAFSRSGSQGFTPTVISPTGAELYGTAGPRELLSRQDAKEKVASEKAGVLQDVIEHPKDDIHSQKGIDDLANLQKESKCSQKTETANDVQTKDEGSEVDISRPSLDHASKTDSFSAKVPQVVGVENDIETEDVGSKVDDHPTSLDSTSKIDSLPAKVPHMSVLDVTSDESDAEGLVIDLQESFEETDISKDKAETKIEGKVERSTRNDSESKEGTEVQEKITEALETVPRRSVRRRSERISKDRLSSCSISENPKNLNDKDIKAGPNPEVNINHGAGTNKAIERVNSERKNNISARRSCGALNEGDGKDVTLHQPARRSTRVATKHKLKSEFDGGSPTVIDVANVTSPRDIKEEPKSQESTPDLPAKRKRGRPRKTPVSKGNSVDADLNQTGLKEPSVKLEPDPESPAVDTKAEVNESPSIVVKTDPTYGGPLTRRRGRPYKVNVPGSAEVAGESVSTPSKDNDVSGEILQIKLGKERSPRTLTPKTRQLAEAAFHKTSPASEVVTTGKRMTRSQAIAALNPDGKPTLRKRKSNTTEECDRLEGTDEAHLTSPNKKSRSSSDEKSLDSPKKSNKVGAPSDIPAPLSPATMESPISQPCEGEENLTPIPLSPPPPGKGSARKVSTSEPNDQDKMAYLLQPFSPHPHSQFKTPFSPPESDAGSLTSPIPKVHFKFTESPLSPNPQRRFSVSDSLYPQSHFNMADSPLSPYPEVPSKDKDRKNLHGALTSQEIKIIPLSPRYPPKEMENKTESKAMGAKKGPETKEKEEKRTQSSTSKEACQRTVTEESPSRKTDTSDGTPLSMLDQIMEAQESFLKSPTGKKEHEERTVGAVNIKEADTFVPARKKDPMEWFPAENPEDYTQYEQDNLTYNLWQLGNIQLIIRCGIHGIVRHKKWTNHVSLTQKMEYQPHFGMEQTTPGEMARNWVDLHIRNVNKVVRVRVNAVNSEVMKIDQLQMEDIVNTKTNFNPLTAVSRLHCVLDKLRSLPVGHYLLGHAPGNAHAHIKKSVRTTSGVYNLHKAYLRREVGIVNDDRVPWIPIDPSIQLFTNQKKQRIPATFVPKDSPDAMSSVWVSDEEWKKIKRSKDRGGKKKRKKKKN